MPLLYDKDGISYNVPHAVDVKEWLASGRYFKKSPKSKGVSASLLPEEKITPEEANGLLRNLSNIGADSVKALARYMKIDYTTKEETVSAIKEKTGK